MQLPVQKRATLHCEDSPSMAKEIESCPSQGSSSNDSSSEELESARSLEQHMSLLSVEDQQHELGEVLSTPVFTVPVLDHVEKRSKNISRSTFTQYGLLAGRVGDGSFIPGDKRVFHNISAPSSTFICGSQGSGKSHTFSCFLENYLISSQANKLTKPLTGLVFHYDDFTSDEGGSPCEAAYLASHSNIKVRVLCSPTNVRAIKSCYNDLNVEIEPLIIKEGYLTTQRMMDLMAVSQDDGPMPLYLHTVHRILRGMRIAQEETGKPFSYDTFKRQLSDTNLTAMQVAPLNQRLETLESFMSKSKPGAFGNRSAKELGKGGNDWTPEPGVLTIIDLSCPCVTPESACSLFNVYLSIFLEQKCTNGRVIGLDEAHKYMNASSEANALANTLLSTIRQQRHLGARIIISTQEPTISPALLDLSSVTIVHRFTSPEWLQSLKTHLAAVASEVLDEDERDSDGNIKKRKGNKATKIFSEIVDLRVGEALLFSPSAMVGIEGELGDNARMKKLGAGYLKIRVRKRLTDDGGKSVMAS